MVRVKSKSISKSDKIKRVNALTGKSGKLK